MSRYCGCIAGGKHIKGMPPCTCCVPVVVVVVVVVVVLHLLCTCCVPHVDVARCGVTHTGPVAGVCMLIFIKAPISKIKQL